MSLDPVTTATFGDDEDRELRQIMARLAVQTSGGSFLEITNALNNWLSEEGVQDGLLTVFLRHTSAGLIIQENADPDVRTDLATAFRDLAPESDKWVHSVEGADDMPAHIKSALTGVTLGVPVVGGQLDLGTWQGVYVAEFRASRHRRTLTLHYVGL